MTHLCTTDDPADSLEWHKKIKADKSFNVQVLPAWRPEAAMKIADKGFATYVRRLAAHGGSTIIRQESLSSLLHLLIRDCLAVL